MPRPTPDSFARRLALQIIMWGLFAAALGGAWQLSRDRDRGLAIPPLGPARQYGELLIRFPLGWIVPPHEAPGQLAAVETGNGQLRRTVIITQELLDNNPDENDLGEQLHHAQKTTDIEFKGLGDAHGQLAEGRFEDERTHAVWQGFVAVVFLQNNLAVTVEMRGVPGFGLIDRQNFQNIVDALKLAPVKPTEERPTGLVPIGDWHPSDSSFSRRAMPAVVFNRSIQKRRAWPAG